MSLARVVRWFDGRRRTVIVALIGWVSVVALAAGADPGDDHWVGLPDFRDAVTAAYLVALAIGAVVLLLSLSPANRRGLPTRERKSWRGVALGAAVALLLVFAADRDNNAEPSEGIPGTPAAGVGDDAVGDEPGTGGTQTSTRDVVLLACVGAAAAAVVVWTRVRAASPGPGLESGPAEDLGVHLAPAIDRALGELLAADDPRTAILGAYAQLEAVVADHGIERHRAETAAEHLTRAVSSLPVDGAALGELGGLYERARFSAHDLTGADRRRAIEVLELAQTSLLAAHGRRR